MQQFLTSLKTEFHKSRNLIFVVFVFFMMATLSFFATSHVEQSSATSLNDFKAGNIMSDAVMGNYNSMSVDDIQRFLTSKNPCNNTDYNQYLASSRAYPNVTWHWSGEPYNGHFVCISEERFGEGTTIGSGQTAAEIIYGAAQEYKINPQVLIVLLEKEQGLITDTLPHSGQYRAATGYGCPDTAACDSKYYGLKNQVYNAAWLFRYTLDNGYYAYPEKTKGVYVAYNPSSSCGRSEVYIENRATAALYRYTPYQPNAAALAAGSGYGDACSAYGNRNFYLYFTSWFGSTQAVVKGEPTSIPEGTYGLSSKANTNFSIDVAAGGKTTGTNIHLWEHFAGAAQFWTFAREADSGYYTITDVNSGLRLSMANDIASGGTNIQLAHENNSCSQRWRVYRTSDGYLTFESACSPGMVLDVSGGRSFNGANLHMWVALDNDAQKWTIYSGRVLDDDVYAINSMVNNKKAIDVYQDDSVGGYDARIKDYNNQISQKWQLTYSSNGDYYTIADPVTKRSFDIQNGVMANGTNIRLWASNNACAQRWKVIPLSGGGYTFLSACNTTMSIDLANSITTNGNNIRLWEYDRNAVGQRWQLTREKTTGYYIFTELATGKALDVWTGSMVSGTNISLWDHYSTCAQRWRIIESEPGYYTFYSACQTDRAVDVLNGTTYNGTNIQLHTVNNSAAQKWSLIKY